MFADWNNTPKLNKLDKSDQNSIKNIYLWQDTLVIVPNECSEVNSESLDLSVNLENKTNAIQKVPILVSKTKGSILSHFEGEHQENMSSIVNIIPEKLSQLENGKGVFKFLENQHYLDDTYHLLSKENWLEWWTGDRSPLEKEFASPLNLIACKFVHQANWEPAFESAPYDVVCAIDSLAALSQQCLPQDNSASGFEYETSRLVMNSELLKVDEYRRQMIGALRLVKNLRKPSMDKLEPMFIDLPQRHSHQKKILIFDLDETLVHGLKQDKWNTNVHKVSYYDSESDSVIYLRFKIRPYVVQCLKEAKKHFQVGVFTASKQWYADAILNYLDPKNELIDFRLYRDSCFLTHNDFLIKDLRIIQNADLKDIIIVDNAIHSFAFQLDNGVPIYDYIKDDSDLELYHLIPYLNLLLECDDIREMNKKVFKISEKFNKI